MKMMKEGFFIMKFLWEVYLSKNNRIDELKSHSINVCKISRGIGKQLKLTDLEII